MLIAEEIKMIDFIDKTSTQSGTPLNRASMMAIQGFVAKKVEFLDTGEIKEKNDNGEVKTTIFNDDGSITIRFVGKKTITKKILFGNDDSITEVIS